jgi:putative flippase GtrA
MREYLRRSAHKALRYTYPRFLLVGALGGVVNVLVFQLCLSGVGLSLTHSSVAGSYVSYAAKILTIKTWVFTSGKHQYFAWQLPADLVLKLVWNALFAVPFLLHWFVEYWGLPPAAGQVLAGWIVGIQNYLLYRLLIFSHPGIRS